MFQNNGSNVLSDRRVARNVELSDDSHPLVRKINQRTEAVTGLSLATAEDLLAIKYDVGGIIMPHVDFASEQLMVNLPELYGSKHGNRFATWLIYLNDEQVGKEEILRRGGESPCFGRLIFSMLKLPY